MLGSHPLETSFTQCLKSIGIAFVSPSKFILSLLNFHFELDVNVSLCWIVYPAQTVILDKHIMSNTLVLLFSSFQ